MTNELWFDEISAVSKGPANQVLIYWFAVGDIVHPQMRGNTKEVSLLIYHRERLVYHSCSTKKADRHSAKQFYRKKTERYGPMVNAYRLFFYAKTLDKKRQGLVLSPWGKYQECKLNR